MLLIFISVARVPIGLLRNKIIFSYKLKNIVDTNNFSAQTIKIITHYKKIGYNIYVLQQTACLVVNPITVGNFATLFKGIPGGSDLRLYNGSDLSIDERVRA